MHQSGVSFLAGFEEVWQSLDPLLNNQLIHKRLVGAFTQKLLLLLLCHTPVKLIRFQLKKNWHTDNNVICLCCSRRVQHSSESLSLAVLNAFYTKRNQVTPHYHHTRCSRITVSCVGAILLSESKIDSISVELVDAQYCRADVDVLILLLTIFLIKLNIIS